MVIVKRVDEDKLIIILDGNREIHVRGNYGEGCAVSFKNEDGETQEFNSQKEFTQKGSVVWEL
jgi:hypothetical protein